MARRKGGGGKLNRTEILQARLTPKLHLAAEILARSQRRTLSSLIETLIEAATVNCKIPAVTSDDSQLDVYLTGKRKTRNLTIKEIIDQLWTSEEADRFATFAFCLPDLLSPEELALWEVIISTPYFWDHFLVNVETKTGRLLEKQLQPIINQRGLIKERLREYWPLLKEILEGKKSLTDFQQLILSDGRVVVDSDYPYAVKRVKYDA